LCTGNAARSVMAGVALRSLRPDVAVDTAGTLAVDGMPMSWRTRGALDAVDLPHPRHASKQATRTHLDTADVVVAMAPEHVEWVRRNHPAASGRTATLHYLVERMQPVGSSVAERITELRLAARTLEPWEEVVDPGGGEAEDFVACAKCVVGLVERFARLL
jgi:protein-tyrosine phosphatase